MRLMIGVLLSGAASGTDASEGLEICCFNGMKSSVSLGSITLWEANGSSLALELSDLHMLSSLTAITK